ncbi:MAG: AraC family transcriptional regulator [Bacteroidota bacterium]
MKPEYELISGRPERSFTAKIVARNSRPLLSKAWHFHPEIEICFTRKSFGKRFVGNTISNYHEGDLVMLGANLPHGFLTEMESEQVVIQMIPDFLGSEFLDRPELRAVKALVSQADRGLYFHGETVRKASPVINRILNTEGLEKMVHLLRLFGLLAQTTEVIPICSKEYSLHLSHSKLERIKQVYDYIIENHHKEIKVKEASDLIGLTEPAFFKFIKKHTKKTFVQLINEFRIHRASKLLISTDMTVAEISFECGYNNVPYFNRKFKEIMEETPIAFRSSFMEKTWMNEIVA